jgi:threonine dehydrogenase-like Zn-dependent dehydrogenase
MSKDQPGVAPFQGAFATYMRCAIDGLYRVLDRLGLRTAALTEPAAVALRGVRGGGVHPGSRVLVTGAGPIGLLTGAVLRASGVDDITVSEPVALRRQLALDVGAHYAVAPSQPAGCRPTQRLSFRKPLTSLSSARAGLQRVMERLMAGELAGKVLVVPRASTRSTSFQSLVSITRFNHMAMSLPPDSLDETGRHDIVAF